MHPSLAPHLHGEECRKIIEQLTNCHRDHPLRKFLGVCNPLKRALNRCLQKEYEERQRKNFELAQERRAAYKLLNDDDE